MKDFPIIFNFILVLSALYLIAGIIYFLTGLPYGVYVLISAIVPLIFLSMRVVEARKFIDNRIHSIIGDLKQYSVYTKSLPGYRFVDVYNAVSLLASQTPRWQQMESQHTEGLAQILNGASTEGVTQAFLKELVYRTVQIATESEAIGSGPVTLTNEDFRKALKEMKTSAGRSGEAIIGFSVER